MFDATAEEKGGRVKFESGGRVPVIGDRDLLFDAISNLIDNAVTHGGGDVQVTVSDNDQGPTISVADRGPGIPLEERKNVLKRFYRLERSRSSQGYANMGWKDSYDAVVDADGVYRKAGPARVFASEKAAMVAMIDATAVANAAVQADFKWIVGTSGFAGRPYASGSPRIKKNAWMPRTEVSVGS